MDWSTVLTIAFDVYIISCFVAYYYRTEIQMWALRKKIELERKRELAGRQP